MLKNIVAFKFSLPLMLAFLICFNVKAQVYQDVIKKDSKKDKKKEIDYDDDYSRINFRLKAGYGIPAGGKTFGDIGFNLSSANASAGTTTYNTKKFSLGGGFQMEGGLTYWFSENFGVDMGLNYTIGAAATGTINTYDALVSHTDNISFSGNMFSIVPSVVVEGKLGILKPYMRCGFVLGFTKPIDQEDVTELNTSSNQSNNYIGQLQLTGSVALGFRATFGNAIALNSHTDFTQELSFNFISYTPTNGEIISYVQNGQEIADQLYTSDRYYVYQKSVTVSNNNQQTNQNAPTVGLATTYPYNNVSIMLGLRFKF